MNPIGIGFVIRNDIGTFLVAGNTIELCSLSEEVECLGILTSTRWASAHSDASGYHFVETDCRATGEFLRGHQSHNSWQSQDILRGLHVI